MNKAYRNYAALYNFSYMAIGAMTPLIAQYLKYAGFSGTQIGTITAAGTTVAVFASVFWGGVYSSSSGRHRVIMLLMIMAAVCGITLPGVKGYIVTVLIFGLMYFFQAPVIALADAYTVGTGDDFGGLRTWGAVGFALGIFITARIVDATNPASIFPVYALSYLIACCSVFMISRKKTNISSKDTKGQGFRGYPKVLANRNLRRLILCTFFFGGTNVANNTYFSFLYTDGGGTLAGVGTCMLIMVGSEAPFMAWSRKLADRFTMEKVVAAAMAVSVIRFGIYALGVPWWMLVATGFMQGIVNGLLLVEFVRYVAAIAPEHIRSLSISAYYVIGSHMSTIVCQITGGYILEHAGAWGVYGFFAAFNLAGLILYMIFGLWKHEENVRDKC